MFLDRLGSHPPPPASPPAGQRAYSPAPSRRPNHLAPIPNRPAFNPRSSSLWLVSRTNSSSGSLPLPPRPPNGSGLRQQVSSLRDVEDPLDVLETIIGSRLSWRDIKQDEHGVSERPTDLIDDVDFKGLSIEEFVSEAAADESADESYGQTMSAESVEEYEKEKHRFEDLHRSIKGCESVLQSVEVSLSGFQRDLGLVSTEIETLQSRSTALNGRLENRKVVEKLLGPPIEEISIAPWVVTAISDGPVDEDWIRAILELQKKEKLLKAKEESRQSIKALNDVLPLLENLTNRAVERIRDYLVAQIKGLRSPNLNAQIIQKQNQYKFKEMFGFLSKHHPQLAEEISRAYVNTMRWYYLHNFTRYRDALEKFTIRKVEKTETLGSDPTIPRVKGPGISTSHDIHNIGRRGDILKTLNRPAVSSYLAEEDKSMHFLETPFRSFSLALVDNVCAEFSFLTEFLHANTFQQISRRCQEIFEPTFALGQAFASELVSSSFDCIGILLCVRLNQKLAFELQRRKAPVADSYVNAINMLLWPRFQVAMDAHSESIKALSANASTRSAASKLSFPGSASDANRQSTAPHFLTQRFSQFLHAILAVSQDAGDDEPVSNSLARLRSEFDAFLQKASKGAGADPKQRNRFLSNNYTLVSTIIADTEGRLALEQKTHFDLLNNAKASNQAK